MSHGAEWAPKGWLSVRQQCLLQEELSPASGSLLREVGAQVSVSDPSRVRALDSTVAGKRRTRRRSGLASTPTMGYGAGVYGVAAPLPPGGGLAAEQQRARVQTIVRDALSRLNERDGVLDLSYNTLMHDEEKGFAMGGHIYMLTKFNVTSCALGPPGMGAIVAAFLRGFAGPSLKSLVVSHNFRLGDAGISSLAKGLLGCPFLPQLEELSLSNTSCGDAGMAELALVVPSMANLQRLSCDCNTAIGEAGWAALGEAFQTCAKCGQKGRLGTQSCGCRGKVDEDGVREEVVFAPAVSALTHLLVQSCTGMGCNGMEALHVGLSKLPALEELDVSNCAVDIRGLACLTKTLPLMPALRTMFFGRNPIHDDGVEVLREIAPTLHIY